MEKLLLLRMDLVESNPFIQISISISRSVRSADPALSSLAQWAKTASLETNASAVAVFCVYNYKGQINNAKCYAKDIFQGIIDEWYSCHFKLLCSQKKGDNYEPVCCDFSLSF